MDIHTILLWLTMCPWSTARNLVELTGLGVSSINRALDDYYNLGWVVSRMIGRGSRATRLWILASEFLELYYAVDHVHGHAGGPDGHRHHPLHPGLVNHKHIPWQDDCKVFFYPLMVSLSNHGWLVWASFDKLRMSRNR